MIFLALSDEENSGDYGARFLTEEHRDLFDGVRYALGEFGGFSLTFGAHRFYPIMVAEKQGCHVRATVRGPGGHGSLPMRGGAMARAGDSCCRRSTATPAGRTSRRSRATMIEGVAKTLPTPNWPTAAPVARPERLTDRIARRAGRARHALRSAAAQHRQRDDRARRRKRQRHPQRDHGGYGWAHPAGLHPGRVAARSCARSLGSDVELEAVEYDIGAPAAPDMALFETLAAFCARPTLRASRFPSCCPASPTDASSRGWASRPMASLPMRLPPDFAFTSLIHAADERIPVEAVSFGADAIYQALRRFG